MNTKRNTLINLPRRHNRDRREKQDKKETEELRNIEVHPLNSSHKGKRGIVCLCGSVRFRQEFDMVACQLSLEDWVVLMPHCWYHQHFHSPDGKETKDLLDKLYFRKIEMADLIYVINKGGYIGKSTSIEIEYAKSLGKKIEYLEKTS
jgi:hypothetical protein